MKIKFNEGTPVRKIVGVYLPSHDSCAGGRDWLYFERGEGDYAEIASGTVVAENTYKLAVSHALSESPDFKNWTPIYEGDSIEITF